LTPSPYLAFICQKHYTTVQYDYNNVTFFVNATTSEFSHLQVEEVSLSECYDVSVSRTAFNNVSLSFKFSSEIFHYFPNFKKFSQYPTFTTWVPAVERSFMSLFNRTVNNLQVLWLDCENNSCIVTWIDFTLQLVPLTIDSENNLVINLHSYSQPILTSKVKFHFQYFFQFASDINTTCLYDLGFCSVPNGYLLWNFTPVYDRFRNISAFSRFERECRIDSQSILCLSSGIQLYPLHSIAPRCGVFVKRIKIFVRSQSLIYNLQPNIILQAGENFNWIFRYLNLTIPIYLEVSPLSLV